MGIAMEHSRLQHHGQIRIHRNATQNTDIALRTLIQSFADDPFCGQYLASGQFIQDGRAEYHPCQGCGGNPSHERFGIDRFFYVVQLVNKSDSPRINDSYQIGIEIEGTFEEGGHLSNEVHVERYLVHDVGSLDFDRHFSRGSVVVSDGGAIDLSQTRRGDGFGRKVDKDGIDG